MKDTEIEEKCTAEANKRVAEVLEREWQEQRSSKATVHSEEARAKIGNTVILYT